MVTPSLALVTPAYADPWRAYNIGQGLLGVARQAHEAGWRVERIDPPSSRAIESASPPILAGPGPGAITRQLRCGYHLAMDGRLDGFDLIVGPFAGGLLQPALMRRATGEAFQNAVMVLVAEPGVAARLSDPAGEGPAAAVLVEDAMELSALGLCDAVAGAPAKLDALAARGSGPTHLPLILPPPPTGSRPSRIAEPLRELVFVGPAGARSGLPSALDAIEALAPSLCAARVSVTFIGPWPEGAKDFGKTLLGVRAQNWPFEFRVIDTDFAADALAYCAGPARLAVFAGSEADDEVLVQQILALGGSILVNGGHAMADRIAPGSRFDPARADALRDGVRAHLQSPSTAAQPLHEDDWVGPLRSLIEAGPGRPAPAPPSAARISVCITHKDRPAELARAVASAQTTDQGGLDVVVVDAGSGRGDAHRQLATLGRASVQVDRCAGATTQGAARNHAAALAQGEVLIFLDDDNQLAPSGAPRLAAPIRNGQFDIVVSALELYDGPAGVGAPSARLTFLGDPGAAGLLFNAFGDGNFAISRSAFDTLGGFAEDDLAAFDWIFLARARAKGLRIGVLHTPAIRYARRLGAGRCNWRKSDQRSVRRAVLQAYDGQYQADLLAYVAQELTLDFFS